jgi:hypothetical protein
MAGINDLFNQKICPNCGCFLYPPAVPGYKDATKEYLICSNNECDKEYSRTKPITRELDIPQLNQIVKKSIEVNKPEEGQLHCLLAIAEKLDQISSQLKLQHEEKKRSSWMEKCRNPSHQS